MERDILHIDMDAFFAAVEQRDHPEWRGKPVIVGAAPDQRGVVATCSYEARRYGVRSAMPSAEAGRRCPHGIFVAPDIARYEAVSQQVFAIFERFTPLVEPVSVDEAFLDITGAHTLFGDNLTIAESIRAAIRQETGGLTASAGVAPNKFLAKLASEMNKPDGITLVPRDRVAILGFLAPLPVGRLWGVGAVLRAQLEQAGYRTIGDLQRAAEPALAALLGNHSTRHLLRLAQGDDDRDVTLDWDEKSISREHTFPTDCRDAAKVPAVLRALTEDVGRRLRAAGRFARVAKLKLRWADFQTLTRQRTFEAAVCDDFTLLEAACGLLASEPLVKPVRLIGFGVTGLAADRSEQLLLFDDGASHRRKRETLCKTVDTLRDRFGADRIRRANERTGSE